MKSETKWNGNSGVCDKYQTPVIPNDIKYRMEARELEIEMEVHYLGNKELLKLPKTAFLASSTIPLDMVLKCFDWAAGKHEEEECIISGFSSKLENDVLHFLIKAKCSVILVLARRMLKVFPDELKVALSEGRLLIISTCNAVRQSKTTALSRNRYICELADSILFVGVTEKSSLYSLEQTFKTKKLEINV